jgi:hypothetical protein
MKRAPAAVCVWFVHFSALQQALSNDLADLGSSAGVERAGAWAQVPGSQRVEHKCTVRSGWTYSIGHAGCGGHISSAKTQEACCSACHIHACCWGWTFNVPPDGNGCWLHGQPMSAPVPKRCHGPCIAGTNGSAALPPAPPPTPAPQPPAPAPPSPGPPPVPPDMRAVAVPSTLQLDWHEHDLGCMITWNAFTNCVNVTDPDASELVCRTCNQGTGNQYRVVKPDAMLQRDYPHNFNVTAQVEAAASFGATYIM